jgi:hypothetical protein
MTFPLRAAKSCGDPRPPGNPGAEPASPRPRWRHRHSPGQQPLHLILVHLAATLAPPVADLVHSAPSCADHRHRPTTPLAPRARRPGERAQNRPRARRRELGRGHAPDARRRRCLVARPTRRRRAASETVRDPARTAGSRARQSRRSSGRSAARRRAAGRCVGPGGASATRDQPEPAIVNNEPQWCLPHHQPVAPPGSRSHILSLKWGSTQEPARPCRTVSHGGLRNDPIREGG